MLRDPIVSRSRLTGGFRVASVIQREELTVLLMRIAAGEASELNIGDLPGDAPPAPEPGGAQGAPGAAVSDQIAAIAPAIEDLIGRLEAQLEQVAKAAPLKWRLTQLWNGFRGNITREQKQIAALWLRRSIQSNGLTDISGALENIRSQIVDLETAYPEWSTSRRANWAILNSAKSDFLAKLNSWFDQTIDRVEEAFTSSSLFWSVLAALAIAFALQLDSLSILNRLGVNDSYRAALLNEAAKYPELVTRITAAPGTSRGQGFDASGAAEATAKAVDAKAKETAAKAQSGDAAAKSALPQVQDVAVKARQVSDRMQVVENKDKSTQDAIMYIISTSEIIRLPDYEHYWTQMRGAWPGVLLSAALLSLGGPFWYAMLKNLLKLRSVLAGKDDDNRRERQALRTSCRPPLPPGSQVITP